MQAGISWFWVFSKYLVWGDVVQVLVLYCWHVQDAINEAFVCLVQRWALSCSGWILGNTEPIFARQSIFFSPISIYPHVFELMRETFSKTLTLPPSLVSWNHSQSLTDLDLAAEEDNDENVQATPPYTDCIFNSSNHFLRFLPGSWEQNYVSFRVGSKCQSCPDLTQMQSLHHVHSQLYKVLHCNRVYYTKNWPDIYNFIQSEKAKSSK